MPYFIVYLFLEVIVSTSVSSSIGSLMTFFGILFTAFIGVTILLNFKNNLLENLKAMSSQGMNLQSIRSLNLFSVIGAIFLIIPGFLTDFIGLFMQLGTLSGLFVNSNNVNSQNNSTQYNNTNTQKDSNVIDVEIINDKPSLK